MKDLNLWSDTSVSRIGSPHNCRPLSSVFDDLSGRTRVAYASLGDQYGFISIYPDSPNKVDQCWDVSSNASLTHNGGGDALGIVSMVRWTLEKYGGDKDRVFVTGTSSGAMMTQVLLGSYPDVFAAGSAWAGVPFGCFAGDGYGVWRTAFEGVLSSSMAPVWDYENRRI
jgi:acetylxylan esterase